MSGLKRAVVDAVNALPFRVCRVPAEDGDRHSRKPIAPADYDSQCLPIDLMLQAGEVSVITLKLRRNDHLFAPARRFANP